jgi:Na+/melibiose symporter-like transporter
MLCGVVPEGRYSSHHNESRIHLVLTSSNENWRPPRKKRYADTGPEKFGATLDFLPQPNSFPCCQIAPSSIDGLNSCLVYTEDAKIAVIAVEIYLLLDHDALSQTPPHGYFSVLAILCVIIRCHSSGVVIPSLLRLFPSFCSRTSSIPSLSSLLICIQWPSVQLNPLPTLAMPDNPLLHDQENRLPRPKLILVISALSIALLVSFIDQSSLGVALPTIGADLNSATTISWAGTSNLIANTTFQVLYGRLSDIFGRKVVFLSAVCLLAAADLACGFASSGPMLYALRGLSGVGSAGVVALTMMIVSDLVRPPIQVEWPKIP